VGGRVEVEHDEVALHHCPAAHLRHLRKLDYLRATLKVWWMGDWAGCAEEPMRIVGEEGSM